MTPHDPVTAARRQALSVAVPTGLYGVSFGALSVAAGLSVPQTMTLSLLMFSGGSQFAFIGVVGAGGAAGAAIASAALLGARNGLYGAQLTPLLDLPRRWRLPAAQLTIDESTAVATAQPTRAAARTGFWWTGLGVFVLWNLFTLLGALAGDRLGDPRTYGLDAAAGAAFLALLWPRLAGRTAQGVAAAAVVVALATTPLLPTGVPVLLAAVVAVVVGLLARARPDAPAPGPTAAGPTAPGPTAPDPTTAGPTAPPGGTA